LSSFQLEIRVTPRPGILDPEGQAIQHSLQSLGYEGARAVRVGKAIHIDLEADSGQAARDAADQMCRKLLANPVTEDYEVAVIPMSTAESGGGE
jgi:phosphoribosylformylglycinamidine synthase